MISFNENLEKMMFIPHNTTNAYIFGFNCKISTITNDLSGHMK